MAGLRTAHKGPGDGGEAARRNACSHTERRRKWTNLPVRPMTDPPAQPQYARGMPTLWNVATTKRSRLSESIPVTRSSSSSNISGYGGRGGCPGTVRRGSGPCIEKLDGRRPWGSRSSVELKEARRSEGMGRA